MLTNSKNFVTEINVSPDCYLCKSDHYLLTFEVRSNVKRNKVPKRKILNFKKANWEALNNELPFYDMLPRESISELYKFNSQMVYK